MGVHLARALKNLGAHVLVYDCVRIPSSALQYCTVFRLGSITDEEALVQSLASFVPDVVVHIASWGMSGSPMLSRRCRDINVGGTETLLRAMVRVGVRDLIYTSSYNVVYGGVELDGLDESSTSYFPLDQHTDMYSRTKAEAEQLVLSANGSNGLHTCALRPAAIYGEGEQRHFPRIIQHIDSGIFAFRIGQAKVDWVHIDNLTEAYVRTIEAMLSAGSPSSAPCGHAYFISDGTPIDNFEFLRPLCEARGASYPSLILPVGLVLVVARIFELLYFAFGLEPFLTRAEVYKVGVTHNFKIDEARRDLNYKPLLTTEEGAARVAQFYSKKSNSHFFRLVAPIWWFLCLGGMISLAGIAFTLPFAVYLQPLEALGLYIFRSKETLRTVFWLALAAHLLEACYAAFTAARMGCKMAWVLMWTCQTALLGFPSLRILLARRDETTSAKKP